MSREAFGDPPDADDREPCDADRPTEIWGVAALAPKQKAAFEKHCTGDCGKISMGGVIDDEVTGGLFVCCQPTCPYEAKEIANYGSTMSFGRPHTVHLRLARARSRNQMTLKPFKHQQKSLKHAEKSDRVFDCSDPGTGKTAVRIWAFQKRHKARKARKALVLAPKTLLRSVWKDDFKRFAPELRVIVSTAGEHEAAYKVPADVYVTNIDAVNWLARQPKTFFKDFDELIIDESTAYKHHTSKRSKAAKKIAQHFKYRSCLTGTPNSNSITDVWHQVYLLDDGKRLGHSFYAFRNAVCDVEQVGRSKHALKWTDREGAEEVVFSLLSDIVVRHKLEECTDIPPNHQYTVDFEMGERQKRAYMQMEEAAILELYGTPEEIAHARVLGKPLKAKDHITAINAAAVATKLLQVASGAVYDNTGKYHVIDTERYELVLDLVEQRKHSVVFFLWDHQRDLLTAAATQRGVSYAVVDGSVKERARYDIAKAFQAGAYQTVLLHPKSAAHGLTLTRGTAAIWASPTVDAEFFNQGSRRVYRLSQTQRTETITVLAKGTRDVHVYERILAPKQQRMRNLLDLFSGAY